MIELTEHVSGRAECNMVKSVKNVPKYGTTPCIISCVYRVNNIYKDSIKLINLDLLIYGLTGICFHGFLGDCSAPTLFPVASYR